MGIKSLNNLLKKYENIHKVIHLSEYAYKKVAIDTSLFVFKYKFVMGEEWLKAFVKLINCLRENQIHCIFIFDGKASDCKKFEQERRKQSREKDKEKLFELQDALDTYYQTSEILQCLIDLDKKLKSKSKDKGVRLLKSSQNTNQKIDIDAIENYINMTKSRTVDITPKDFETAKNLFDLMGIPYHIAPEEAETLCSDLCKLAEVDAVLTEDTDVLAYGSPIMLCKINTYNGTCTEINHENMLNELDLQYREFLDLCIFCGTDYNTNIPGIGVMKSYEIISKFKSIEAFEDHVIDLRENNKKMKKYESQAIDNFMVLNYKRVRELFTEYKTCELKVKYCREPDWEKLSEFLFYHNCNMDISTIKKSFEPPEIVFED